MKILKLERHAYSPEQNKIYLKNGVVFDCLKLKRVTGNKFLPSFSSVSSFREYLKPSKLSGKLHCTIESFYADSKYSHLNRVVASGFCLTRLQALRHSKQFQQTGGHY